MGKTLILNSSNVVSGSGNSKFVYNFPQGGYTFKDDIIAIQEIAQYFSAFNIQINLLITLLVIFGLMELLIKLIYPIVSYK
jgi:hypothetical protein